MNKVLIINLLVVYSLVIWLIIKNFYLEDIVDALKIKLQHHVRVINNLTGKGNLPEGEEFIIPAEKLREVNERLKEVNKKSPNKKNNKGNRSNDKN